MSYHFDTKAGHRLFIAYYVALARRSCFLTLMTVRHTLRSCRAPFHCCKCSKSFSLTSSINSLRECEANVDMLKIVVFLYSPSIDIQVWWVFSWSFMPSTVVSLAIQLSSLKVILKFCFIVSGLSLP